MINANPYNVKCNITEVVFLILKITSSSYDLLAESWKLACDRELSKC